MKWTFVWKSSVILGVPLGAVLMLLQWNKLGVILPDGFAGLFSFLSCWLLGLLAVVGGGEVLMPLTPFLWFIGSAISGILIVMVCEVVVYELVGALLESIANKKNKSGNRRKHP